MNTIQNLNELRQNTSNAWDSCVDTCIDIDGNVIKERQERAEEARDTALDHWDSAIMATGKGDVALAVEYLEAARRLAADWGDSGSEDAALGLLQPTRPAVDWDAEV